MNKMSLGSKGLESGRKRYRVLHKRNTRQRAAVTTSVKGAGRKIGRTDYVPVANLRLSKGWALKKQKAAARISSGVKEFLANVFNTGAKDLHQKLCQDVLEQIKKTFPVSE